ncbi:MAG: sulfatase [Cyclobacteriaceae bacterium]|nr:sulfatase [Cyclobacteriaceae bacterium]
MNNIRLFTFYLFTIHTLFISCSVKRDIDRPNILFIMADDHTSQAWGIYGGALKDFVQAPNISRLAEEGCTLKNVFCTNSICTPSRASIMTGKYSHQNGVYTLSEALEPDSMNVAKVMKKSGYQTAIVGKWHLKKTPEGFDYFNVLPGQGRYNNPILRNAENWSEGGKEYKGFSSDVIGDEAILWLSQRDKSKPFMLMTHFKATHEPFDYPERKEHIYDGVDIPEPENLMDFEGKISGRTFSGQILEILGNRWIAASKNATDRYPGLPFNLDGLDSVQARKKIYQKYVKDFLRSGSAIDDNIGKLLDYLDANGLAENTVVVYTADQGFFLGEHGFFDKRMFYEEALRMPFVIRYPKEIKGNTWNEDMILNLDFPSLFLDYAGIESEGFTIGRSFRANLTGNIPEDWRKSMYYRYWLHQTNRPAHFGIRNNRYKLIFFYGQHLNMPGAHRENTEPAWEFYDLQNDPKEDYNAYSDPGYTKIIDQMKEELIKLRKEIGDTDEKFPEMENVLATYQLK